MSLYPEIIVGTYEEFLLGYAINKSKSGEFELQMTVASHAHQGSIRSVDTNKHFLASSGADEYINIFSLLNKKEIAILTPHSGTVTCLAFVPDGSHLISASQDGNIGIIRCSDWRLVKVWKEAHKRANGVLGISVHPSGKLLLSIGADSILRAWNLIKGRQAYAVNFGKKTSPGNNLNLVTWSGDGSHYAVCIGQCVEIYSTDSASIVYTINAICKVSCVDFEDKLIILGRDDGYLEIHNVVIKKKIVEENGHDKRVKCAKSFKSESGTFLISADSMGCIKLWTMKDGKKPLQFEAKVNADCRIVCLALACPKGNLKKEDVTSENGSEIKNSETPEPSSAGTPEFPKKDPNQKNMKRKSKTLTPQDRTTSSSKSKSIEGSFISSEFITTSPKNAKRFSTSQWQTESAI